MRADSGLSVGADGFSFMDSERNYDGEVSWQYQRAFFRDAEFRLQIEQLQMGAPLRTSVSTVVALMAATAVLLLACTLALQLARRKPESWGGR